MQDGARGRNGLIDALRCICAVGIVWFHSEAPGHRVAYIALPFFLVLLSIPMHIQFRDRATRLLRPWLIWSAIFAAGESLRAFFLGEDLFGWFQPSMILYGTMIHLWFLPFAFVAGYILVPIHTFPRVSLYVPLIAALFVSVMPHSQSPPFPQWFFGIVPAAAGAAFFAQKGNGRYLALISLLGAFLLLEILQPQPDNLVILLGSGLAMGAFMLPVPSNSVTKLAAQVSFPVYLSHPIFLFFGRAYNIESYALAITGVIGSLLFGVFQVLLLPRLIRLLTS